MSMIAPAAPQGKRCEEPKSEIERIGSLTPFLFAAAVRHAPRLRFGL
jgi:hypothetical protein